MDSASLHLFYGMLRVEIRTAICRWVKRYREFVEVSSEDVDT